MANALDGNIGNTPDKVTDGGTANWAALAQFNQKDWQQAAGSSIDTASAHLPDLGFSDFASEAATANSAVTQGGLDNTALSGLIQDLDKDLQDLKLDIRALDSALGGTGQGQGPQASTGNDGCAPGGAGGERGDHHRQEHHRQGHHAGGHHSGDKQGGSDTVPAATGGVNAGNDGANIGNTGVGAGADAGTGGSAPIGDTPTPVPVAGDTPTTSTPGSDITTQPQPTPAADAPTSTPITSDSQPPPTAPTQTNAATGKFYTSGDQIIGPDGKPFVPVGINDTEPTEHDELTPKLPQLAAEGVNTIRIMGNADDLETPGNAFNQEVQAATNAGMLVDISYTPVSAQYGGTGEILTGSDLQTAETAIAASAQMYANNPNVAFNVINESGQNGDANNPAWLAEQDGLLAAANSAGSNPLKIVDDTEWGSALVDPNFQSESGLLANAANLKGYGNVVGAFHDYQGGGQTENVAPGVTALQQAGMPVMAEEVGFNGGDDSTGTGFQNTLSQLEAPQSTTGAPVGGLVWIDGNDPTTGAFYNNIMDNSTLAPQVQNFWSTANAEAATAIPAGVPTDTQAPPVDTTTQAPPVDSTTQAPPVDTSTQAPPTDTAPSGQYSVVNGQIIGPDGKPFDAKGVAVYAGDAQADAATVMQQMPDLNFIRLAATPGQDTPADIQADIQAFQKINPNVVVEVEDHTSGGTDGTTNSTLSGQALADEENWYAQIATANKSNPNVWFGTANEPNNPSNEQTVVDQETGIYDAIRGTGSNAMVMLEADGGGFFAPQQADTSAYSGMTNVAWDDHYYGWETNGDNSVQGNVAAIQKELAGASGITESDGRGGQQAIPTIIGEYGNSTTGMGVDANATGTVDAVQTANNQGLVQGAVGWVWDAHNNPNGDSDAITQDGTMGTVTNFGQEIINYVNTGNSGDAQ